MPAAGRWIGQNWGVARARLRHAKATQAAREDGMDYWLYLTGEEDHQLIELAQHAEMAGLRGVALADHVVVPVEFSSVHPSGEAPFDYRTSFPDPLTNAAAILASTEAGSLSLLSGDRFRLGVGVGWLFEEVTMLGQSLRGRGRRMDEMLEIMRAFWTQESVEYHGEFFDFPATGMAPRPDAPVPIWVGGKSRAALARAARHDGWLGMNYPLPEVHDLLSELAELRADVPARESDFEVFVIPNAEPSPELHADLAARGVTGTMAFAWPDGDPAFASLAAKQKAIDAFATAYIEA
jgi:alkanesulfonate monooxygenase SsuD/methylene tetrahydromethanopterin reductase-like flavin-dependent oxidoreductase (luciferase family)